MEEGEKLGSVNADVEEAKVPEKKEVFGFDAGFLDLKVSVGTNEEELKQTELVTQKASKKTEIFWAARREDLNEEKKGEELARLKQEEEKIDRELNQLLEKNKIIIPTIALSAMGEPDQSRCSSAINILFREDEDGEKLREILLDLNKKGQKLGIIYGHGSNFPAWEYENLPSKGIYIMNNHGENVPAETLLELFVGKVGMVFMVNCNDEGVEIVSSPIDVAYSKSEMSQGGDKKVNLDVCRVNGSYQVRNL